MDKQIINFTANEQRLVRTDGEGLYSSNKVSYIEAHFALGDNWSGFDSVRAIWYTDRINGVATVLDPDGICIVPPEVLRRKGDVLVNLVGSITVNDELTDRLTSYPIVALTVDANTEVDGTETAPITPSQFEQFVSIVHDEVSEVTGMRAEAVTLTAGSEATASYADGVLTLGIPRGQKGAKGDKGDTGDTGATGATGAPAGFGTVTATVDDQIGTPSVEVTTSGADTAKNFDFAFHNLKGEKGDKGDTGEVSYQDLATLLPTDTGTGDIVSITDGQSIIPVQSLVVDLEPIQDLHGYDKPWSGGAGKNKMPPKTGQAGPAQLILGDDATAIASASGVYLKSGTYTLSVNSTKTSTIYWYDVSSGTNEGIGNTLAPRTVTVSADGYYFPFLYNSSGISSSDVSTFQLEQGSSATSYEPYSNICPISGHTEVDTHRTGVNVWDEEWEVGGYNANTGTKVAGSNKIRNKSLIKVLPNTTYFFACVGSYTHWITLYYYDADGNFVSSDAINSVNATFTTPSNAYYMAFNTSDNYGTTYNHDISINYPSTDHEYHAYDGTTYTTPLGQTVYGGVLDVISGELVVDRAIKAFDGSEDWTKSSAGNVYYCTTDSTVFPYGKDHPSYNISDKYAFKGFATAGYSSFLNDGEYLLYRWDTGSVAIRAIAFKNESIASVADWKALLQSNPVQVIYELATPITIQLTPQEVKLLLGNNTIWSDGDVAIIYKADVTKYVEKMLA